MNRLIIASALSTILVSLVFGEIDFNAKYGGDFMSGQSNARLLALGGTGVAISSGTSALLANPALIFPKNNHEAGLMHIDRFSGAVLVDHGIYAQKKDDERAFALGFLRQGIDDNPITELEDPGSHISNDNRVRLLGYSNAAEYAFQFGYVVKRNYGSIGANAKLIYKDLADNYAVGLGVDIGYALQRGNLMLGAQIRNALTSLLAWDTGYQEAILPNARFGIAYLINAERLMAKILPVAEIEIRTESIDDPDVFAAHYGLEYKIRDVISARAGIDDNRPTYGAGLDIGPVSLDYAFVGHDDLGESHRISIGFDW